MTLLIVRLPKGKGRRSLSMQIKRANSVNQNEIFRIQPRLAGPFVDAGCRVVLKSALPHFVWRNYPETVKFRRDSCEFEEALVARERCCR